jgi:hypothetical protein
MQVPFIKSIVRDAIDVPTVMDNAAIAFTPISNVNWREAYPYCPEVQFRIAYNKFSVFLHYKVTEDTARAIYGVDNGSVWTDSCVEFFCMPAGDGIYYNIECNCIGTLLLGAGTGRENRELAGTETLGAVQRWASLGRRPFQETSGQKTWEVALILPYAIFFKHNIRTLAGKQVKANFYKCGDELQKPHFLSWNPIKLEKPDFHCPDFFGTLEFVSE